MGSDIRPVAPFEHEVYDETIPASADLSANQFLFHVIDSSGELALAGDGTAAYVLQNEPDAQGVGGVIRVLGSTEVVCGSGGVTMGDRVTPDSAGKLKTAATGDIIRGIALQTLAADERGTILLDSLGIEP